MSHDEFDALDELYFIKSLEELSEVLGWDESKLTQVLKDLWNQGFIKVYAQLQELDNPSPYFEKNQWASLQFIASKKGLLEHNRI